MLRRGVVLLSLISRGTAFLPSATASTMKRMRGGGRAVMSAAPSPQELMAPQLREGALGFEDIATIPKPGQQGLSQVAFSPDGRHVTYLGGDPTSLTRQLLAFDCVTGETRTVLGGGVGDEAKLSKEEQLQRERARIMSTGVTSYAWAAEANRLLVPLDGALYILDGVDEVPTAYPRRPKPNPSPKPSPAPNPSPHASPSPSPSPKRHPNPDLDEGAAPPRRLFDPADSRWAAVGSGPLLDAKISAGGNVVCFVWADEVCCCAVPAGAEADAATPRRLTSGARGEGKTNGLADYCAQEEMDRYVGYWLSPDAASLAYEEVDGRHSPHYRIARHAASPHEAEEFRYPFAGAANPKVRLGWTSTKEGEGGAAWFDLTGPYGDDFYLARVDWAHDGTLLAQVQSRDQRDLTILRLDPATGSATPLHREHNEAWVNLHDMLRPLKGGGFLWASEQDGWRHLWVHAADGQPSRRLTSGAWLVEEVAGVDEANGYVYYLGTGAGHLQRHLYRVRLAGEGGGASSPEALTKEAGYHAGVSVARDGSRFVDQYHSTSAPAVATLCALPSGDAAANTAPLPLYSAAVDPRVDAMAAVLRPPRLVSLPSTDGSTTLEAAFYAPDKALFGEGPYPTVVSCYGGPHVQFVADSWVMTADLRAQFLRSQGFLVIKCDNRGSDRRGLPFKNLRPWEP